MLPPGGKDRGGFQIIIVAALGAHFGLTLARHRCFPYGR
jgi:hypothetical protein